MGDYVFALKKSLRKNAILNGKQVQVDMAPYAYKPSRFDQGWPPESLDFGTKMWLKRSSDTPSEEQAPYVVFTDNPDGFPVHVSNKLGVWDDGSGYYSGIKGDDLVGKIYKIAGRYHIVPKDQDLYQYIKDNVPSVLKKPLPHTQMYVKMHEGYTATVRDIKSLEEYLAGYGKVDPNYMATFSVGDDVPKWFQAIVSQLVSNKRSELNNA